MEKIITITEWPVPKYVEDIKLFMGLAGYYRQFVEGFSRVHTLLPLYKRKERPLNEPLTTKGALINLNIYSPGPLF